MNEGPEFEMPQMPDAALLGLVVYDDGQVVIQVHPNTPAKDVVGMLRSVAAAVEDGHTQLFNLN